MRCWLMIACALVAWPACGQEADVLAPLPAVGSGDAIAAEQLSDILDRLDRLEWENATLRAQLHDAVDLKQPGAPPPASVVESVWDEQTTA